MHKIIDVWDRSVRLAVDGGVKANKIRVIADAGADIFVAGSAIFGAPSYRDAIDSLRKELARRVDTRRRSQLALGKATVP